MSQRVIITGGASGLGAALCELLRSEGCTPIPADITCSEGVLPLDVTVPGSWETALDEAGPFDALVNCAGTRTRADLIDMEPDDWDRVLSVNLRGPFLGIRAAARRWRAQGRGGVI